MSLNYYNKSEDISKKESINNYYNIFKDYYIKFPTLSDALIQMFKSHNITDQKAYELKQDIIKKAINIIDFNFELIKKNNPIITKEEAYIISSYTCDSFDLNYSPYRILNNCLNDENRMEGIKKISKYFFIFLNSLRKLNRYYPKKKYMYRCINKQLNLKEDFFNKKIVPYQKGIKKCFYGFISITSELNMNYNLEKLKKGSIYDIIGDFWGYDISLFNENNEEQIILEPEHKFEVMNAVPPSKSNEITHIRVRMEKYIPVLEKIIIGDGIRIIYEFVNDYKKKDYIRIFGENFARNYKFLCTFYYEGIEFELDSYFPIFNLKTNKFEIILRGIENITDISYMFSDCDCITSLSIIDIFKLKNISNMNYMFSNCLSLLTVSDLSKLDTSDTIDMSFMFYGCKSLLSLNDISKWNISLVTDIKFMFFNCESLISLPDISNWNTYNITNMSYLFSKCFSISFLPEISNWNTYNITNMSYLFSECSSISYLPDISKWNTSNIKYMNGLFSECESLLSLPDISRWDIKNVIDMSKMFYKCTSLLDLPDISKWNISFSIKIDYMFYGCSSLIFLPDISKWNVNDSINAKHIFDKCYSLSYLPNVSKNCNFDSYNYYIFRNIIFCDNINGIY